MFFRICNLIFVVCFILSINLNIYNCDIHSDDLVFSNSINENFDEYAPTQTKENVPNLYESEQQEKYKSLNTKTKIKLLEIYLNELKYHDLINELATNLQSHKEQEQEQQLFDTGLINSNSAPFFPPSHSQIPVEKRNDLNKAILYKKRMRNMNDRKRPGWELAYGRRKRSIKA